MTLPSNPNAQLRLGILFAVPFVFSVLFFVLNMTAEHNSAQLIQLQSLNSGVGKLRSLSNDAEIGIHGFLLTGDDRYLSSLEIANARVQAYTKLLPDGKGTPPPDIEEHLNQIVNLVRHRLADANRVLEVQRLQGFTAALDLAKSDQSRQIMDDIRSRVEELQSQLNVRIVGYLDRERLLTRWIFLLFLFGTLIMLLVTVWLYQSLLSYIRDRDLAHAQLETLNSGLEQRIASRTGELQQFNEELQQFAYVASHDLQEPLRTITTFTQLLAARYKGHLDADADEFMGYIVTASKRMTDLINGLLALVRLRKSGQSATPVSLDEVVREAEASLQASLRESGATVEFDRLPALVVDRVQFSQVFQNLISNAIKYRSSEPPVIRIEAKRAATDWIISVSDNGKGFDQRFAERIFGLFQRLESREIEGTGMGLAISRKIMERHGGRIWAESTEGVGSTFYLSVPVSLELRPSDRLTDVEAPAGVR